MTHRRLLRELGVGEMAYWHAIMARETERYKQARKKAERDHGGK